MKPLDDSILCRAAIVLPVTATGEFMYMPGGLQTITPFDGGIGEPIRVLVDAAGAAQIEAQRSAISAKGKRAFFDFNHEDGPASFWPAQFFWREQPEPGIYCRGEWSTSGKAGVEGKEWRQFSPVFHVDNKRGNPARIACREHAKPNMGGLVNDPAFHRILPLWAKDSAGAAGQQQNQNHQMNEQDKAALQAKIQELNDQLDALKAKESETKAKKENADLIAAEIRAKEHELKASKAEADLAEIKAKHTALEGADLARREADADKIVVEMVADGRIAAKDETAKTEAKKNLTENPAVFGPIYAKWAKSPALSGRITTPGVLITAEAPNATMKAYAALVCANAKLPVSFETYKEKGKLAREAAAIFARDIENDVVISGMSMEDAIKAADNSDAAVGLLSGTLVLQRALPAMMYQYPLLSSITQDFSDAPGLLNQTEKTRITLKPAVQTYSATPDSAGRPTGWVTASPAQMVDVPVTLTDYVGVPIVFGNNILASTVRNLFAEQAPLALNAIGGYAVNMLTALMTAARFNAYKGTSLAAGATTSGSTTVTVTSTANAYLGAYISGTGIPSNTYVAAVVDATTLTLTQAATATNTGLTLTLSNSKVPTTYATYVKALADFDVASMGDIKSAFDVMEVPEQDRFALLNSNYHTKLGNSPTLNSFFAAVQKPEIITKGMLPEVQGFNPLNAPWFPSSSNRTGFAGHKAALILKNRLPQDFTTALGAMVPGNVTTVTAPGGISVLLVQYVSLRENYAEWRPETMLGAAVGDPRAGLVMTSQ